MVTLRQVGTSNVIPVSGHHTNAGSNEEKVIETRGINLNCLIGNAAALKSYLESTQRDLEIEVNEERDCIIVRVIEKKSGKTIRQIPSEELLQLANNIDKMLGLLFEDTA